MSKEEIKIKSNGIRNELKEIRKSIDNLTNAIIAQTHKHHEKNMYFSCGEIISFLKKNRELLKINNKVKRKGDK